MRETGLLLIFLKGKQIYSHLERKTDISVVHYCKNSFFLTDIANLIQIRTSLLQMKETVVI